MDSKWPQKGSKLFLPKIEYNRLENTTRPCHTSKLNSDLDGRFILQETIESNDSEGSTSPLVDQNDRTWGSFTKFSVLPPIQGKRSSKGKPKNLEKRNPEHVSGAVSSEQDLCSKRKSSLLHRQTALLTADTEAITLKKTNADNLKIVGKRYSGLNNNTRNHQQTMMSTEEKLRSRTGNLSSRPSSTPNASHPLAFGSKSTPFTDGGENDSGLIYSTEKIPQDDRRADARPSSRRFSKFRRFNSDTSNERKSGTPEESNTNKRTHPLLSRGNYLKTNLFLNPAEQVNEKRGYVSNCRSPRPISRCHIDINMNEAENINLNLMEDRIVSPETIASNLFDTTLSADGHVSSSAPLIQISTEEHSSTQEDRRESQNSPSIKILINSLDSAKEEILQDAKLELPKMSVREQRRRSALCRANSKQVDDFLLVHNLKDLGLL